MTVTTISDSAVTVRRDDGREIAIAWHQLRDAAGPCNADDLRALYAPPLAQARATLWYSAAPGHLHGLPGRPAGELLDHSARALDPDELMWLLSCRRQQREIAGEIDRAKAVAP